MNNDVNKFVELVENQFKYGGKKYANDDKKEATDILFDRYGKDWFLGTINKYIFRYTNVARERDLLKIACYSFIMWLKRGFHIDNERIAPINTTVENKKKSYPTWVFKLKNKIEEYEKYYMDSFSLSDIEKILFSMNRLDFFCEITESEILKISIFCYFIWKTEIKNKGEDQDINHISDKK